MSVPGFPPYGDPQPPTPAPHQPGTPPHPGSALPPPGFLALTIQGSVLTSNINTPSVVLDGRPVPVQYGFNSIPVIPGRHHVHVHGEWMRRYGQADLMVDVAAGQQVPVFYRAPVHQFTTGNIGHVPQPAKGVGVLIGIMVLLVACITLPMVATALL